MAAPASVTLSWSGPGDSTPHEIEAQFNPNELTFEKSLMVAEQPIPGLDSPILQFVRGQAESLSVELFFDTTDERRDGEPVAVTERTDRVYELVKIDPRTKAPPIVTFAWGQGLAGASLGRGGGGEEGAGQEGSADQSAQRRPSFRCVVERLQQRFTLFSPEGVPLRAVLTLTLKEYLTLDEQVRRLDSRADQTRTHGVREGDTLSGIAERQYGDSSQWRAIADANDISDPSSLDLGATLEIPPL